MINYKALIDSALSARELSYSPYSGFKVGCAILCPDGEIFQGCNIENASYSETVCAERVALLKAVSQGKRSFKAIAVVGGKDEVCDFVYPCGPCRQALNEFCDEELEIVLFDGENVKSCTLGQLFPCSFSKKDIK